MPKQNEKKEYVFAFPSMYKAMYAEETLLGKGIKSTLKRLPPQLIKSCGYALHVRHDSIGVIKAALVEKQIFPAQIYILEESEGKNIYKPV